MLPCEKNVSTILNDYLSHKSNNDEKLVCLMKTYILV